MTREYDVSGLQKRSIAEDVITNPSGQWKTRRSRQGYAVGIKGRDATLLCKYGRGGFVDFRL